ncbi:MAG: hypothetical protein LQ338_000466 [Usnochroma carphineum]|nr:MAG: hypothetical protein LQ338_000466 [Usnochroma carphineum]
MVQKKTYLLLPNFDYPPDGPIVLGSIITDPSDPGRSLNRGSIIPRPADCPVDVSTKNDWKGSKQRQASGRVGIWAKFVDVVAGGNLGVQGEKSSDDIYEFAEMETQFFEPTYQYIARSMDIPAVMEYIKRTAFRKNAYMITGLKIVKGAKVATERRRGFGGDAQAGFGGAAAGLPVQLGPDISGKVSDVDKESFEQSSGFVFAMRLREIYYQRGKPAGLADRGYNKGALYDVTIAGDGNPVDVAETHEPEPTVDLLGSARKDLGGEDLVLRSIKAIDDDTGEECECVVLA